MKSTKIAIGAAVLLISAGLLTASQVAAQGFGFGGGDGTLITRLAEKFGKSESEVQAVFDEVASEKQAERESQYEAELQTAVDNGELTADQQALILAKHQEVQAQRQSERQSMQGLTAEERRAKMEEQRSEMEARRTEMETWASENGIDLKWLMGLQGPQGQRGGPGEHGGPKNFGN